MNASLNIACFRTVIALALAALTAAAHAAEPSHDLTTRQEDVARRGAAVMPFDLNATTHAFAKEETGGTQRVTAKPGTGTTLTAQSEVAEQVARVRSHLKSIAAQFAAGNFAAPTAIHGAQMPGLAALRAAPPGLVMVRYGDVPGGGELQFRSNDPQLVASLHAWFDAQVSDHGRHAHHRTSDVDGASQHRQ